MCNSYEKSRVKLLTHVNVFLQWLSQTENVLASFMDTQEAWEDLTPVVAKVLNLIETAFQKLADRHSVFLATIVLIERFITLGNTKPGIIELRFDELMLLGCMETIKMMSDYDCGKVIPSRISCWLNKTPKQLGELERLFLMQLDFDLNVTSIQLRELYCRVLTVN